MTILRQSRPRRAVVLLAVLIVVVLLSLAAYQYSELMTAEYRAADNVALGGNMSNPGFGLQVRGTNPYRVRMLGGTFQLPGQIQDPLQRDG